MAPDRHQPPPRPESPAGSSTVACQTGPFGRPESPAVAGRQPVLGDDCWILSGPTASGKTALAVALARRLQAEIVSVDSMAVYRGLDIGTAKPSADQRVAVPHHVVDVVESHEPYSVARWLADAAAAVDSCRARGRGILFVGGTPLYLRGLRDGLDPLPAADPALRQRLTEEAEGGGAAALHTRLASVDPAAAARIHPHDTRRIIRALEVVQSGSPAATSWSAAGQPHPAFASRMMVVDLPRRLLYQRIDRRVEAMFAAGLVEETRTALAQAGGIGPTALQAAGYAEAAAMLAGRVSLAEAIRLTKQRTRQLAKRQLTWLRSFKQAVWITA